MLKKNLLSLLALLVCLTSHATEVTVKIAVRSSGEPMPIWLDSIRELHDNSELVQMKSQLKPLTQEEKNWLTAFQVKLSEWGPRSEKLSLNFAPVEPPKSFLVVFGNQGGTLGEVMGRGTLAIDLSVWAATFPNIASTETKHEIIERFLAKKFTHFLMQNWAKQNSIPMNTAMDRVLWDLYSEGFSQYKALNPNSKPYKGKLPAASRETLNKLSPVLVERLTKLRSMTKDDEEKVRSQIKSTLEANLWSTMPIALWLAIEANGDDSRLKKWVQLGPPGVIELAKKHLAPEMKHRLERAMAVTPRSRFETQ
jgi:hypothetical protein